MELHEKYAPILKFNKDERFFPMRVDDMLAYSSLYAKGEENPILKTGEITPDLLVKHGRTRTTFLRSIITGPMTGPEVVEQWGKGALEMVYRWTTSGQISLSNQLAQKAYSWFSPKTARAAQLFWWNGLVSHVLDEKVESAGKGELPRLILPQKSQQSAIEQYAGKKPGHTYYYRMVKDGKYLCLQYWFFYSYNNWGQGFSGMNDHEGDWEGVMISFALDNNNRIQEPPAYITFADHESCQTKPWGHEDVTFIGNHPVGYVAAGSHATYPEAKKHPLMELYHLYDYATGDGLTIDHDDWVHRQNLDEVDWLGKYQGSWGTRFWLPISKAKAILQLLSPTGALTTLFRSKEPEEFELPGVSAPFGPVGIHRPQYANPVAWAGLPKG